MAASFAALCRGPIARGAILSAAIRVAALGLGFAQAILTARLLGPEGYGVVAVALSVTAIAATLSMLGFGPLAVREVAQLAARAEWGRLRGFLRFSTLSVLAVSVLAAAAIATLALATPLVGPSFRGTVALAAPLVPMLALLAVLRGQCQGFGRVVAAQAPGELLRPAVMAGALGMLLAAQGTAQPRVYILIALGTALAAVAAAALSLGRIVAARVPAGPATAAGRDWSRAAAPFLCVMLLGVVGTEASTLILGWLAGPREAGLFQPIIRIAPILMIATEAISIPLAPRLAQLWEHGDIEAIRRLFHKATLYAACGTAGLAIALLFLSPLILSAFGRAFLVTQPLLIWVAVAQTLNAAFGSAGLLLAMAGRMKARIVAQTATMLVQVVASLLLIGPYGAAGATAALVAAILTWSILHWFLAWRILGIDTSLLAVVRR